MAELPNKRPAWAALQSHFAGVHLYDPPHMKQHGFVYHSIGRSKVAP